jgi:hypothetical protein
MKHLFFVPIFAIAALFIIGCSSSNSNSEGKHSCNIPPAADNIIPFPSNISDYQGSRSDSSRTRGYQVANLENINIYHSKLAAKGWNCPSLPVDFQGFFKCFSELTVDNVLFSLNSDLYVNENQYLHKNGESFYVEQYIEFPPPTEELPSKLIFDEITAPSGCNDMNGYQLGIFFPDDSAEIAYKAAYETILTNEGFLYDNDFVYGGDEGVYWKDLDSSIAVVYLSEWHNHLDIHTYVISD